MNVDVSDLCCVNSLCADYGKRGAGNLVCRKIYGNWKSRFLRCRTCGEEFSERKGTPLFGIHLEPGKALGVLEHLGDGCGVRKTARLVCVSKNTVTAMVNRAGGHAKKLHDELVRNLNVREVQFDEKWSFVGKKRQGVPRGRSR